MTLYLLRHAIAVERGSADYRDDSKRPLTAKGARKMKRVAAGMKALDVEFDLLLSSPYVRARQTAEIVATVLRAEGKLHFSEHLAADGNPRELVHELARQYRSAENMMIVGHEPDLSRLASVLLTGKADLPLTLRKAGLIKLAVERLRFGKCATLEWLLSPRVLAAAAQH